MKTRVGSKRLISGRKTSPAPNRALTNPAQKRLNSLVSRANDRHANAMAVDGVELMLWRKQNGGKFCSCGGDDQKDDAQIKLEQGNEQPTPPTVEDVIQGARKFEIVSLRNDKEYNQRADEEDLYELENDGDLKEVYEDTDDEFADDGAFDPELEAFAELKTADEKARLQRSVNALLTGGENAPCGICFSTLWTEGYQLQNGQRIALSVVDVDDFGGFEVNKKAQPQAMGAYAGAAPVVFSVNFPTYFLKGILVRVMNNLQLAAGIKVEVQWPESITWEPFTLIGLNMRNGLNNYGTLLRAKADPNLPESQQVWFTHIEIMIETAQRLVGQMPNIDSLETFEFNEAITQTNIEFPARVNNIEFGSIVIDSKYRRAWRVTGVTPNRLSNGGIISVDAQATKLQLYEPCSLLNPYRHRHVILKNFKGLGKQLGKGY